MSISTPLVKSELTPSLSDGFTPGLAKSLTKKAKRTKKAGKTAALPDIDRRLVDRYMLEINRHALLSREQEQQLAKRYVATGDEKLYHRLVTANLRFVVKVAHEFKGYKAPLSDLIQEGNVGLMMAVKKFDPARGYRLISYAVWWIRAYLQAFVMKSFSLVKIGTTVAQRKLFFKLRSGREELDEARRGQGERASDGEVADRMNVPEREVTQMELRLAARDFSIDAKVGESQQATFVEMMADDEPTPEQIVGDQECRVRALEVIDGAVGRLDEREQYIMKARLQREEPETLRKVGSHLKISRERVRQLQEGIIHKLRRAVELHDVLPVAA